jgi:hypothetical protein
MKNPFEPQFAMEAAAAPAQANSLRAPLRKRKKPPLHTAVSIKPTTKKFYVRYGDTTRKNRLLPEIGEFV